MTSSGPRNPAMSFKCRIVERANMAPSWLLYLELYERRSSTGAVFTSIFPLIERIFWRLSRSKSRNLKGQNLRQKELR